MSPKIIEVPVNEGWAGYVLAKDVVQEKNGRRILLLKRSSFLTAELLHGLKKHGIKKIEILAK